MNTTNRHATLISEKYIGQYIFRNEKYCPGNARYFRIYQYISFMVYLNDDEKFIFQKIYCISQLGFMAFVTNLFESFQYVC